MRGYVYVLVNSSLPGLVKVGKTTRLPSERVGELSGATGVPTPFIVAFEQTFEDCDAAETYVHATLERQGLRQATNREFFRASPADVIRIVMNAPGAASESASDVDDVDDIDEFERSLLGPEASVFLSGLTGMQRYIEEDSQNWQKRARALEIAQQAIEFLNEYRGIDGEIEQSCLENVEVQRTLESLGQASACAERITKRLDRMYSEQAESAPSEPWADLMDEAFKHEHGTDGYIEDEKEAYRLYRDAARLGCAEAYDRLGQFYRFGWGVREDLDKAIECYKEAAKRGYYWAYQGMMHVFAKRDREKNFHASIQKLIEQRTLSVVDANEPWWRYPASLNWYIASARSKGWRPIMLDEIRSNAGDIRKLYHDEVGKKMIMQESQNDVFAWLLGYGL